ncbi:hypothetical protein [Flexivirga sp. B27]
MPEDLETRTVMTPRTGTKICILIGLAFIVAAAYFYFVPVTGVRASTGSVFGCGTAANPADSTFAKGTCWRITDVEKYRAFACVAIGVITIVLGAVMFGVDRRTESRPARHTDGYADDRRRWDDEPRRRRAHDDRDELDDRGDRPDYDDRDRDGRGDREEPARPDTDRAPDRGRERTPWDARDRGDRSDWGDRGPQEDSRRERRTRRDWDVD